MTHFLIFIGKRTVVKAFSAVLWFASSQFVLLLFLTIFPVDSVAQKQLIVLRNGTTVVARYSEGSKFKCVLKNRERKVGVIMELRDFSMITTHDTIEFQSIAKIDRRGYYRVNIMRDVAYILICGGLIYFTADQINNSLGYDKHDFDQGDRNALIAAGIGAAMLYIKSPYRHVGKRMVMRTVDKASPYYLSSQ